MSKKQVKTKRKPIIEIYEENGKLRISRKDITFMDCIDLLIQAAEAVKGEVKMTNEYENARVFVDETAIYIN